MSLADRITKPAAASLDGASAPFTPSSSTTANAAASTSWADEVASPTGSSPEMKGTSSLGQAQVDGACPVDPNSGSALAEGAYEVEVTYNKTLGELQAEAANPLYSVKSFEELGILDDILKGIHALGFEKPSKIQERALPLLLTNPPQNMIAQSQSGTGKTAAFVLTILQRLDRQQPHQPQALVLAPSRELARQIEGVVRSLGTYMDGLTIQAAVPGAVARGAKLQAMVVVGTPGTAMDLIKRRQLDVSQMKVLCLDEADNMLDQQGLGEQCLLVKRMIPNVQQILLFSATFPDEVLSYAEQFSPNASQIKLKRDELNVAGIKQMFIDCPSDEEKYRTIVQLYGMLTVGSSIIFVKRRESASRIAERLSADGHKVVAIHGAFDGADRDRILEDFRSGRSKVLITTNVLARGIDVSTVTMVINYDIPMKGRREEEPDFETYLHRIGRTGRFGRVGVSISFVFDSDSYNALVEIAAFYKIDLVKLEIEDRDAMERTVSAIIKSSRASGSFKN